LTSILAVHQDLPAIGWTVAPVGCVLAGHVNGLAPAEQVREVFSGWRSALGLDGGPGEHVGDAGAVHLQAMAYRCQVRVRLTATVFDDEPVAP
jgi:hypothetical protein